METLGEEIDDSYSTPTYHLDDKLFSLTVTLENNTIDENILLGIYLYIAQNNINVHYTGSQRRDVIKALNNKFVSISNEFISNNLEKYLIVFIYYFREYITTGKEKLLIDDENKKKLLGLLIDKITSKEFNYVFFMPRLIGYLLQLNDIDSGKNLLNSLKKTETVGIFKDAVYEIRQLGTFHPLYEEAEKIFRNDSTFEHERDIKAHKEKNRVLYDEKIKEMKSKEQSVMMNLELIKKEIQKIYDFIDDNNDKFFNNDLSERMKYIQLQEDTVSSHVENDYNATYSLPPVFSQFVLNILFKWSFNDEKNVDRQYLQDILDDWFSNKKYYWRFIYEFHIKELSEEHIDKFFVDNNEIKEKILSSMKVEMSDVLKNVTLQNINSNYNHNCFRSFIFYVQHLYSDELPENLKKSLKKELCFMSYWAFSSNTGFKSSGDFSCYPYDSVCDWYIKLSGSSRETVLEYVINNFDKINDEWIKAQNINFIFKNLSSANESLKNTFENIFIKLSCDEFQKKYLDYTSISPINSSLATCWKENNNIHYIDRIIDSISEEWFDNEYNYCQNDMLNNIIRISNIDQKNKIISKLSNLDKISVKSFLAGLGYDGAICFFIDGYLNGESIKQTFMFRNPFGFMKKSKRMLKKYISLLKYSLSEQTERRYFLQNISKNGIIEHVDKKSFKMVEKVMDRIIKDKQKSNQECDYYEGIKAEIKQRVYQKADTSKQKPSKNKIPYRIIFTILSIIAVIGFMYCWYIDNKVGKIFSILFGLFSGFCSILPFWGIDTKNNLIKKILEK